MCWGRTPTLGVRPTAVLRADAGVGIARVAAESEVVPCRRRFLSGRPAVGPTITHPQRRRATRLAAVELPVEVIGGVVARRVQAAPGLWHLGFVADADLSTDLLVLNTSGEAESFPLLRRADVDWLAVERPRADLGRCRRGCRCPIGRLRLAGGVAVVGGSTAARE